MNFYSGKFVLRTSPDLHKRLRQASLRRRQSLNRLCTDLLMRGLEAGEGVSKKDLRQRFGFVIDPLKERFGSSLSGVLVFGSQVTGEALPSSDVDFLIVLEKEVPLTRSLYRFWDETIESKESASFSPQFVLLPASPEEAGGLWFEVALAHEILWEKEGKISRILEGLKKRIASGQLRRYTTQGQSYWVRS